MTEKYFEDRGTLKCDYKIDFLANIRETFGAYRIVSLIFDKES